jgi:molecular chaperone DnaK
MATLDRAVGIDLGTTNSEIAWLPPSERELVIYADRFGRRTVPSAVSWDEKAGVFVVGHAARQRRGTAESPVESIKRKMGQKAKVKIGPHELTPEEVSSKILAELRARMVETLKPLRAGAATIETPVVRAVITVPAYFDAPQVEATRKAGELAGFEVIGILQEPTAAAIYHTWRRRLGDGNYLVYDLGGGTFDVSILRCVGGEYQVLAIDGDNYLGGDDLDRRFAEHLRKELVAKGYALDLDVKDDEGDRRIFGRLVHLAQEIKESLSTSEVAHVSKSDFAKDKSGESISYEGDIGRADYERIVSDLVETTIVCRELPLPRAREVADVSLDEVDHVILVGGSTRVPLVVRRVTEALCKKSGEPLQDDVDTCVALGAAVHAAHVGGTILSDKGVKVRITTPLVAQGTRLKVGIAVEQAPPNAAQIAIWGEGEAALGEAPVPTGKEPVRIDVPLGEAEETHATIALQSSFGAPLAEMPITFTRGDLRPRPTSLSRASVVAKDIALEVVRSGKRERKVLIARGTGLPAQVTQRFFTTDQTGAVVLRILQNRLPIKTLVIEVPKELPVGSHVEILMRCDESMRLDAKATIGVQEIQAHIEPPQQTSAEVADVDALLEQAEKAKRALWGDLGTSFAREADRLAAGIREVVQTDPDKLQALCERLRHIVEEFHGTEGESLVPPMPRMEEAFSSLRRIVYRQPGAVMGVTREDWDKRIDGLYDKAMAAHEAADGPTWRRVYNELQALIETAYQEEFAATRMDDPAYVGKRILGLTWRAERLEITLKELVPSAADEVKSLQKAEQARVQKWLEASVTAPLKTLREQEGKQELADARRMIDQLDTELDRVEAAVERIPSLGLVTDRGGS